MSLTSYSVEVEISILAQAFQITMEATGMDEEEAKADAEEYVRDNIRIVGISAEAEEDGE